MIEPNADRDAIQAMRDAFYDLALKDPDNITSHQRVLDGINRVLQRNFKVVDAESWDRFIRSERRDADQFERLAAVVRAVLADDPEWVAILGATQQALAALTADDIEAVADALH